MTNTYDTSNEPLGSTAVKVLYNNASNLDEAVNSDADTWVDRPPFGRVRRTWRGMENAFNEFLINSGYEFIGDYDADGPLTITRPNQVFSKDGEYWRAGPALALPYTTVNNWVVDQPKFVSTGDATLRQALAQASGSDLVGFRFRTVANRLNDTANVKDYGAIADGTYHPLSERYASLAVAQLVYPHATALTDSIDWAAFQSALNAGTARVHAPAGHYVLNKQNTRSTHITLTGDGYGTYLDYSQFNGADGLLIQGALTQINNLGAYIAKGARQLVFLGTPSLVNGDVVIVYNPTDGSWLSDRTVYRAGEYFRVHSMAANIATIYGESTDQYLVADVQVWKLGGIHVTIEGVRANPATTAQYAPIKVLFGNGVRIRNCWTNANGTYTGIAVERSFDVEIDGCTALNASEPVNNEYGITIVNCQNVVYRGGSSAATRHAIALGGTDAPCCVPNRNVLIYGAIFENVDIPNDIGAGDMHGGADCITYDNCVFRNGVIMQGRNATVRNSLIYGVSSTDGSCIYGTEIKGGVYTIENNRMISRGVGASFGIVHLSPGPSMTERLTIVARNNTIELPSAAFNTKPFMCRARGATQPMNIVVDGLEVLAGTVTLFCFVYADDNVLSALNSEKIIVDNVSGPSGTPLLYPHAKIASVPTKQMRQSGAVNVTTTAAATVAAPAQTIRYPYSKMPNVSVQVSSQSGGDQSSVGSVSPIPIAYNVQPGSIRPAIMAPSGSFAAGGSARLHWTSSLDDI